MGIKVVAIIQARMSSTRLIGKMAKKIGNISLMDWVVLRVKQAKLINEIVVATTDKKIDDELADLAEKYGLKVFRGSENNVLNRFYLANKLVEGNVIVRICADNPFIDALEIDSLIKFYLSNNFDYCFNNLDKMNSGFADGFGAEIFSKRILDEMNHGNLSHEEKEHLTKHIWDSGKYSIGFPAVPVYLNHPEIKLDIDSERDLQYIRNLVNEGVKIDSLASEIIDIAKIYEKNLFSH